MDIIHIEPVSRLLTAIPAVFRERALSPWHDHREISCLENRCALLPLHDMSEFAARTPQQLGEILRGFRREKQLTQHAVGKEAGLLQSAISQIESDPGPASLVRIYRVLSALELELVVRPRGMADRKTEW